MIGAKVMSFAPVEETENFRTVDIRASDGREAAKARGAKFGRKPKSTDHQQKTALNRLAKGDSSRLIAKDMGVSHSTIVRLR
ncbi:MAG: helix-turn-helix domain-containing protein [Cyanobacteria bacterium P01_F01_bin.33]